MAASAQEGEKTVVLIAPEALGGWYDQARLRATLVQSPMPVRVLLCLPQSTEQSFVDILHGLGVEMEILLGPEIKAPDTHAFVLRAPHGTSPGDQNEFALALSDVVLVASSSDQSQLSRTAAALRKPMIVPGDALPVLPPVTSAAHRLDPEVSGWHALGRRWFGRLEQGIMELLAFAWKGWTRAGLADSVKRLRRCASRGWLPRAYFAPDDWQRLAPDSTARDSSATIIARFESMDRSALHGSYVHRDLVWIAHLAAAFAVLAAVAGYLSVLNGWGIAELGALLLVVFLVFEARHGELQDRWTACRLGAEQLRIARMSLPLLVLPPALATADAPPSGNGHGHDAQREFSALAEVKRVVRDHGLPKLDPALPAVLAAKWLQLIVGDQLRYHQDNHKKLERAERRLRLATQAIFFIAMAAVVMHLYHPLAEWLPFNPKWLLLFTAAGPAFAAALHGAGTRLGIVHRQILSLGVDTELAPIDTALQRIIKFPPPPEEAWPKVRALAYAAAETMGRENTSWHGLVRRYRDELP